MPAGLINSWDLWSTSKWFTTSSLSRIYTTTTDRFMEDGAAVVPHSLPFTRLFSLSLHLLFNTYPWPSACVCSYVTTRHQRASLPPPSPSRPSFLISYVAISLLLSSFGFLLSHFASLSTSSCSCRTKRH